MSPPRRRQRGAVALEFALVFPIAIAVVGAIIYLGLLATYSGLAEHGVRKAARFGGIRDGAATAYPTDAQIKAIGAKVDPLLGTPLTVTVTRTAGAGSSAIPCVISGSGRRCGDGDVITVAATYDAGALAAVASIPGFPGTGTITRTATARFE